MKIAVIPSNQHLNDYAGFPDPSVTEESVMNLLADAVVVEFERQGYQAKKFWVPGAGLKSTDELGRMLSEAMAWQPDFMYSLHSDCAAGVRDIFPQIRNEADRPWGTAIGKELSQRTGMPLQYAAVRGDNLMFFYYGAMEKYRATLMEIGRHNTAADAQFNVTYSTYLGIMAARSFLKGTGLPMRDDGPVPLGVAVPPGQEKYLPSENQETGGEMTPEQEELLTHSDRAASQNTYDIRIANRLAIGDYQSAVDLSNAFYERWPDDYGSLPKGLTVEELQALVEG